MNDTARTSEKLLTYDEWRVLGLQVLAGEKSVGRNADGKAVFSKRQVHDPHAWMAESEDLFYWDDPT